MTVGVATGEVAREEVGMAAEAAAAAARVAAETGEGAKGAGGTAGGERAGAATAAGATATRTWKRCAPRQGSRCDSRRAGRWSHTSRQSGCNQMKTGRPWRAPPQSSGRPAGRFDRQRLHSGSRTARKWRSCSRPQTCPPRSGSDRGDPSSSRAGCRFERGSRATLGLRQWWCCPGSGWTATDSTGCSYGSRSRAYHQCKIWARGLGLFRQCQTRSSYQQKALGRAPDWDQDRPD